MKWGKLSRGAPMWQDPVYTVAAYAYRHNCGEGRCAFAASRWAVATACRSKPKLLSLLLLVLVLLFFSYPPNFHNPISTTCGSNPQNLGPPGPCQGCRLPHPKSDWPASAAGPRGTWQSGWRHHCPLIRLCALLGYGCIPPRTRNLCCPPIESGSDPILIS